jgi:hypothetical protein
MESRMRLSFRTHTFELPGTALAVTFFVLAQVSRHFQTLNGWSRVTRLGEFSPVGRLFIFGQLTAYEMPYFRAKFFEGKIYALRSTYNKWVWLHFGRLFRQPIRSPWLDAR